MEIDGKQIAAWVTKASDSDLLSLIGSTYSDRDSEWCVESFQVGKLRVREYPFDDSCRVIQRPLSLFCDRTFFFEGIVGDQIKGLIQATLSPLDIRIEKAKIYLSSLGFPLSDMGGDPVILSAHEALALWEKEKAIPSGESRSRLYEIFSSKASLQRLGAHFFESWTRQKERQTTPTIYDANLRLCWATLCRHAGKLESSLLASSIVDLPSSQFPFRKHVVAELCTVRAAAMMDMAEQKADERIKLLANARRALNKAYAIEDGNSDYVRNAYMRLKLLESGRIF